jgi:hypothetical protein
MKSQKHLRDRYIQLVENFINAIEEGRSGSELEDIRNEIRILSQQLKARPSVENHPQQYEQLHLRRQEDINNNSPGNFIS